MSPQASIIDEVGRIPIREVSGLALQDAAGPHVLAIGDHDFLLAFGRLTAGGVPAFDTVDLGHAMRQAGVDMPNASQWEAVKSDGPHNQ